MIINDGICEECGTDVSQTEKLIDDLIRERNELRDALQWQSIETAPEGVGLLVTGWEYGKPDTTRWMAIAVRFGQEFCHPEDDEMVYGPVTHWVFPPVYPK